MQLPVIVLLRTLRKPRSSKTYLSSHLAALHSPRSPMQDPDQDLVFPITDGRYLLGVRSSPTTYGHVRRPPNFLIFHPLSFRPVRAYLTRLSSRLQNLEHIENGVKTTDLGRPLSSLELPPAVVREIASDLPTQSIFHQPASYIHFSSTYQDILFLQSVHI